MLTIIRSKINNFKNLVLLVIISAVMLPLLGCDSKTETIVGAIPDAENLFFTPEGRLFVSGGENVFEIVVQADGNYQKLDMFHEDCLVEGITQRDGYIYGVCSKTKGAELLDSYLIAGKIETLAPDQVDTNLPAQHPTIKMEAISPLSEILIPNGIVVDSKGDLYIADYGSPKIFKVALIDPTTVAQISVWARRPNTLFNGLKWHDNQLYFSGQSGITSGIVGKIEQLEDGSAGEPEILFKRQQAVLDDILPYKGGLLITDYLKGSILFWKEGEVQAETPRETFFAPSAVALARSPMFEEGAPVSLFSIPTLPCVSTLILNPNFLAVFSIASAAI